MRRILPVLFGCVLLVVPSFGAGHGGGGGGHSGGGGMRGGGGGVHGGGGFRSAGGYRGGGYRGGFRGNYGGYRGRFGYGGFYYPGFYGYYNPFLWDTGFGWDYGDSGYGYPDYGYSGSGGYPSYAAPNPQVLVISNQTPPQPVVVQPPPPSAAWNSGPTTQAKKYEEPLFLLAMNDGTIRAVLAYWVDGPTVHYVTMDHVQKQTPLASLDRGLSERLNRERNVTFSLPG